MYGEVYKFGTFLSTETSEDGNTLYTNEKTGVSSYDPLEAAIGPEKFAEINGDVKKMVETVLEKTIGTIIAEDTLSRIEKESPKSR